MDVERGQQRSHRRGKPMVQKSGKEKLFGHENQLLALGRQLLAESFLLS